MMLRRAQSPELGRGGSQVSRFFWPRPLALFSNPIHWRGGVAVLVG